MAAEQNYQRKLFEQDQQWNDLSAKFEDAKIKLVLIEKIEEAQKIKAHNERDRLNRGRTVTFQVLNFEQDYAQSELARIQSETNILNIYSQLKAYSAGGTKMNLASLSIKRPVFITCIVISVILVVGWLSLRKMPVDPFECNLSHCNGYDCLPRCRT